jgi:hypothetical protein
MLYFPFILLGVGIIGILLIVVSLYFGKKRKKIPIGMLVGGVCMFLLACGYTYYAIKDVEDAGRKRHQEMLKMQNSEKLPTSESLTKQNHL